MSKALVIAEHRDPFDPVLRLLASLRDADNRTEAVLRSFRLPESAYVEATEAANGSAARAVGVLKRIAGEATTRQPAGRKGEILALLTRIKRDLERNAETVATLIEHVEALDIPEEKATRCESCGIPFRGPLSLAEHVYIHHHGPVPEHYLAAERLAGLTREASA